ncbi:MAG: hypothetical protein O9327_20840, partial [Polaromonas sp.]|nr:hypothetical protein [Polaromonas sp.]
MKFSILRNVALYTAALIAVDSAFAVVAQEPLLSKTVNVRPNIALVLDTSGSMDWECVYAKHVATALVTESPNSTSIPGFHVDCISSSDPRQSSPVNNLLFYNPKKVYSPGYSGGVQQANAAVGNSSVVELYLPKAGKDPTTYTTSAAIKNTADYNFYEVTTNKFKLNGANTSGN